MFFSLPIILKDLRKLKRTYIYNINVKNKAKARHKCKGHCQKKAGFCMCVRVCVCVCGGGGADLIPLAFVCIRRTKLSVENFYSYLSLLFLFAPPTHPN